MKEPEMEVNPENGKHGNEGCTAIEEDPIDPSIVYFHGGACRVDYKSCDDTRPQTAHGIYYYLHPLSPKHI